MSEDSAANSASNPVSFAASIRLDRKLPTVQQVYRALRGMIIAMELPPGTTVPKARIAEELGVSQTPVREALLRLQDEGLVDIFPQSRTVVSLIDVQDAHEAQFLRLSVEVEIARRLAEAPSETVLAALRRLLDAQHRALEQGDLAGFTEADQAFHRSMYEHAGVGGLWSLVHSRRAHIDRLRRLHLPLPGKREQIMTDHEAIYRALAARDPAASEAAVRNHLAGTLAHVDAIRDRHPEYFSGD